MVRINKEEYWVLNGLDYGWEWIAEDKDTTLWVYEKKPKKKVGCWDEFSSDCKIVDSNLFQFIRWDDEEPHNIKELIEEYERGSEETEERKDIELLKEQIEIEIRMWDGAESGWAEYAVDKIFNLIDKFLLSDKGGNCDDKKD